MYEKIKQSMADAADAKIAAQKWEGSIKYQEELLKTNPQLESRIEETWIGGGYGPGALLKRETNKLRTQTQNYIEHGKKKLKEANEKRDNALEAVDAYWEYVEQEGVKAEVDNLIISNGSNGTTPGKGRPVNIEDEKKKRKEAKERKDKIDKYIAEMEQAGRDAAIAYAKGEHEGSKDYYRLLDLRLAATEKFKNNSLKIAGLTEEEKNDVLKKYEQERNSIRNDYRQQKLKDEDARYSEEKRKLDAQLSAGNITTKQYNEQAAAALKKHYDTRLSIVDQYCTDEKQLLEERRTQEENISREIEGKIKNCSL